MATAYTHTTQSPYMQADHSTKALWLGGAESGITSGIIMALVAMFTAYAMGAGFWTPVRLIAATFMGQGALTTASEGPILLGLVTHLIVSAIFGIIFAYLTTRVTSVAYELAIGVLYGIVIWAVMTFIVVPTVDPVMSRSMAQAPMSWFIDHIIFGVALVLTPYFERLSAAKRADRV